MLLLLVACSDNNLQYVDKSVDEPGVADILVDPVMIDFGSLKSGEVATGTFTITNEGDEDSELTLTGLAMGEADEGFEILTDIAGVVLPAGGSQEVELSFTPMGANEQSAKLVVASDDEDEAHVEVNLVGQGLTPELEISPDPYDFGSSMIGCAATQDLTLTNVGADVLTISEMNYDGVGMEITRWNSLPFDLDPGASTKVTVTFTPDAEHEYRSELSVVSNEPRGTRTAAQTGTGTNGGDHTDSWEVSEDPAVDILFSVDQSGSMDDDQRSLTDAFSKFITELGAYTDDWQIAVANDDNGCNNSGILTESTSNYESKFENAVSQGGGVWTEALLTVTASAIDKTDSGECNENFMRPDAMLHIIMVTDEPEQSWGTRTDYVDEVVAKKGDASLVKYSAVAGPVPGGCVSGGNSADAGTGYDEAVDYTGGVFLSICSDWGSSVEVLADASIEMSTFELSQTPDPSTIEVSVNGTKWTANWRYESTQNAVFVAEGYELTSGDEIDISYTVIAGCAD